jgi:hypothetical protein
MARRSKPEKTAEPGARSAASPAAQPSEPTGDSALTWEAFEARLAAALERMPVESFLIVTTPARQDRGAHYVQFAHFVTADGASTALRAEAVSSEYLPPAAALAPAQEEQLDRLGWERPDPSETSRNRYRTWQLPAPFPEIARLAVRTLREVYGITRPTDLRHVHAFFERGAIPDPDLGIPAERRTPARTRATGPRTAADLVPLVEKALVRGLGVEKVVRDEDGDYPIRVGSALIYLRLLGGKPPLLQLFGPVLRGVTASSVLLAALNEINSRVRFARAFWANDQVVVAMELTAIDLTPEQITFACIELGNLADHLDDGLHGRFGGATTFPTRATLVN